MAVCKGLGLLCMFLGCVLWGIGRAMEYREREENTHYLIYILDGLISQIVYGHSTVEDCLFELAAKVKEPFRSCFLDIYEKIREDTGRCPFEIMEQGLEKTLSELHIDRDAGALFVQCFQRTSFQDALCMEQVLGGIKERLLEYHEGALTESRKRSRLAVYLGMFGGMFCVILCL